MPNRNPDSNNNSAHHAQSPNTARGEKYLALLNAKEALNQPLPITYDDLKQYGLSLQTLIHWVDNPQMIQYHLRLNLPLYVSYLTHAKDLTPENKKELEGRTLLLLMQALTYHVVFLNSDLDTLYKLSNVFPQHPIMNAAITCLAWLSKSQDDSAKKDKIKKFKNKMIHFFSEYVNNLESLEKENYYYMLKIGLCLCAFVTEPAFFTTIHPYLKPPSSTPNKKSVVGKATSHLYELFHALCYFRKGDTSHFTSQFNQYIQKVISNKQPSRLFAEIHHMEGLVLLHALRSTLYEHCSNTLFNAIFMEYFNWVYQKSSGEARVPFSKAIFGLDSVESSSQSEVSLRIYLQLVQKTYPITFCTMEELQKPSDQSYRVGIHYDALKAGICFSFMKEQGAIAKDSLGMFDLNSTEDFITALQKEPSPFIHQLLKMPRFRSLLPAPSDAIIEMNSLFPNSSFLDHLQHRSEAMQIALKKPSLAAEDRQQLFEEYKLLFNMLILMDASVTPYDERIEAFLKVDPFANEVLIEHIYYFALLAKDYPDVRVPHVLVNTVLRNTIPNPHVTRNVSLELEYFIKAFSPGKTPDHAVKENFYQLLKQIISCFFQEFILNDTEPFQLKPKQLQQAQLHLTYINLCKEEFFGPHYPTPKLNVRCVTQIPEDIQSEALYIQFDDKNQNMIHYACKNRQGEMTKSLIPYSKFPSPQGQSARTFMQSPEGWQYIVCQLELEGVLWPHQLMKVAQDAVDHALTHEPNTPVDPSEKKPAKTPKKPKKPQANPSVKRSAQPSENTDPLFLQNNGQRQLIGSSQNASPDIKPPKAKPKPLVLTEQKPSHQPPLQPKPQTRQKPVQNAPINAVPAPSTHGFFKPTATETQIVHVPVHVPVAVAVAVFSPFPPNIKTVHVVIGSHVIINKEHFEFLENGLLQSPNTQWAFRLPECFNSEMTCYATEAAISYVQGSTIKIGEIEYTLSVANDAPVLINPHTQEMHVIQPPKMDHRVALMH